MDERGTMKSVVEYFMETYGFVIRHTQWPCLQVGNTQRPNYLPMEVEKLNQLLAVGYYVDKSVSNCLFVM